MSQITTADSGFIGAIWQITSESTRTNAPQPNTSQRDSFLTFFALLQELGLPILPVSWQRALSAFRGGATSSINQLQLTRLNYLAFKCISSEFKTRKMAAFMAMTHEVAILGQTSFARHPNIVKLLGVCWDIQYHNKVEVWPVLVMEKANCGDLWHFLQSTAGRALEMQSRMKLCQDIGRAVAFMHAENIIHGDLKPENVLINQEIDGSYVAKVMDFGHSTRYVRTDNPSIRLPISIPWQAPEYAYQTTAEKAEKMDIFSFGLVCFYLLFEPYLQSLERIPERLQHNTEVTNCWDKSQPIKTLIMLKNADKLTTVLEAVLETVETIPELNSHTWKAFLVSSLSDQVELRQLQGFGLFEDPILSSVRSETMDISLSDLAFDLRHSFGELYDCEYLVRSYVASCLKDELSRMESLIDHSDQDYIQHLKLQNALCYYLGLGVKKDDTLSAQLLNGTDDSIEAIRTSIPTWRPRIAIQETQLLDAFHVRGYFRAVPSDHGIYAHLKNKAEVESHLKQDMHALEACGQTDTLIWLRVARQLFILLWMHQESERALQLLERCIPISEKHFGEDHTQTLVLHSYEASLLSRMMRYDEAEFRLAKLIELFDRTHGRDHLETLSVMSDLAVLHRKQQKWNKAEKLDRVIVESREQQLGFRHEDVLAAKAGLARTLCGQGAYNEAQRLGKELVALCEEVLGENHHDTLGTMADLGSTYFQQGDYDAALDQYWEVSWKRLELLGLQNPSTVLVLENLASCLGELGAFDIAETFYQVAAVACLQNKSSPIDALAGCIRWGARISGESTEPSSHEDFVRALESYFRARPDFRRSFKEE